jgi:2-oxo-3-hexenedioate decarboxylase/2-keto-4-pentenoate hydratase
MISDRMFSAECCEGFVGSAMASIELVDDRWTDFRKVSTPALVSENFFNAGCVLGRPVNVSGSKLKDVVGQMRINGTQAGTGSGSEILGHPYAALAWLANHQMKQSAPLKARDFVTLGSVVQTRWIDVGDVVEIEFTELGKCSLHLEP